MAGDYKDTLLMPKTDFPMQGNLNVKEPEIQKKWEEEHIYERSIEKHKDAEPWILHDGPPYANGPIHCGHALNKVIKDFIVRSHSMMGYYAPYIPGWDTHGLPIEVAMTKALKVNRKEIPTDTFRDMCRDYAFKQIDLQRTGFKRLGVSADWDHPYITLQPEFEAMQIRAFAKMVERGLIFRGLKPVYWSWSSESALAEAEVEYQDVTGDSIYVAFDVNDGKGVLEAGTKLVIWTTTPWTLPANEAIVVHPDFNYVLIDVKGDHYVVAEELLATVSPIFGWDNPTVLKTYKGRELEYITYSHPLMDKKGVVILGRHATLDAGTGLIHTAPGLGEDDFNVGKLYNLPITVDIDDHGILNEAAGPFKGLFYEDGNKAVIETLTNNGHLLAKVSITHSYPFDWRTKKPIVFRATEQWFCSIEKIKPEMMKAISDVSWKPSWGDTRLGNMIKERKEWCISRQRVWGVPIPVFYAEDNTPILDPTIIYHIADIFEKEGSNAWFKKSAQELLPEGYKNSHSPNGIFRKESDIMDVWFDSGSSHQDVLVRRGQGYPCALYFEGSDQYRGWFNSSLSVGVAVSNQAPYKGVLSHGFILDGEGRKMSKSLGNTIDPIKMVNKFGADVFRLWVATVDYTADVRISEKMVENASQSYRKIRNTMKFLLGNLFDYDDTKNKVPYEQLGLVDKAILNKMNDLAKLVIDCYKSYDYMILYKAVMNFITNDLSAFYADYAKDILYIEEADSLERRSIQTVFYKVLFDLTKLLTPILPHTMEQVYSYMNVANKQDSIYLEDFSALESYPDHDTVLKEYDELFALRSDILKALEEARNNKIIGKSMQASVTLHPSASVKPFLASTKIDLKKVFIVASFNEDDTETQNGVDSASGKIEVTAKDGQTCERCWQIVDALDENGLCSRCAAIVKKVRNN